MIVAALLMASEFAVIMAVVGLVGIALLVRDLLPTERNRQRREERRRQEAFWEQHFRALR